MASIDSNRPLQQRPLTISQLVQRLRTAIEPQFRNVWIEGELSNYRPYPSSGHWYFTLKDSNAEISSVCFRSVNQRIRWNPNNGMLLRAHGSISIYRGRLQFYAEELQSVGEGTLHVMFERLKQRLAQEGLFAENLKRPLPRFPRRVAVITSPTGAVLKDILNVLTRRTRTVHILVSPARVQGHGAAEEIVDAIRLLEEYHRRATASGRVKDGIDVMILARGGGSLEDLWPFNEEVVARAIRASTIPIISAIGHETDVTIADFAADRRAPTPSAAAELVAEQEDQLKREIKQLYEGMDRAAHFSLMKARNEITETGIADELESARLRITEAGLETDRLHHELDFAWTHFLRRTQQLLSGVGHALSLASPHLQLAQRRLNLSHSVRDLNDAINLRLSIAKSKLDETGLKLGEVSPQTALARARLEVTQVASELSAAPTKALNKASSALRNARSRLLELSPKTRVIHLGFSLESSSQGLNDAVSGILASVGRDLILAGQSLKDLSPFSVLERGYALVEDLNGRVVRDYQSVASGDEVIVQLAKGRLDCLVQNAEDKSIPE